MAEQTETTFPSWRAALTLDRVINGGIALAFAAMAITLVLSLSGNNPWPEWQPQSVRQTLEIDLFFAVLYTAVAFLYAQNLIYFIQTRDALYLTYCLYVTVLVLHIVLYEQLLPAVGIPLPAPWDTAAANTTYSVALILIFRFARRLLDTPRVSPRLDRVLQWGMLMALVPPVFVYVRLEEAFLIVDIAWFTFFGTVILWIAFKIAMSGHTAALIFALSFFAHYLGFYWSYAVLLLPELDISPLFNDDASSAESAIWIGSLALEALLMSVAAHLYTRGLKNKADAETDRADKLERAVQAAQVRIAEMAEMAETAEAASQNAAQANATGNDTHEDTRDAPATTVTQVANALRDIITTNAAESFVDVEFLVRAMATSKATLTRRIKEETGLPPNAYIRKVRLELAQAMLKDGSVRTVGEAAAATGFASQGHFARHYKKAFGESPVDTLKPA